MLIDLHVLVHQGDTDALLETLPVTLLDGLCLVDLGKLPEASLVEAARSHGKAVFVGAQVALEKGHVLAFPPTEDFDIAALLGQGDDESLRALDEAGCALLACQPYDKEAGFGLGDWVVRYTALHGILAVTASSSQVANDLALEVVENLDVAAAGGTASDGPLGKAATLFAATVTDQAGLVDEIKRGDCWAVSLGAEDRWTSVERRPERSGRDGRDRGGRDGRTSRPRGRGGRDGENRGRGRSRGSRDGRGGRDGRGRDGDGRSTSRDGEGRNKGRGGESRSRGRGDRNRPRKDEDRGNRVTPPDDGRNDQNGNVRNDQLPPDIDGNR
jgi:hypothetical protein